jgi:hypothetical protein
MSLEGASFFLKPLRTAENVLGSERLHLPIRWQRPNRRVRELAYEGSGDCRLARPDSCNCSLTPSPVVDRSTSTYRLINKHG